MVLVSITGYTFAALNRHGQSANPNTKRKLPTIRIQRLIGLLLLIQFLSLNV